MKYDHAVIYNGKFYAAGSEVPVKENKKPEQKEEKVETKKPSTSKRK